MKRGLFHISVAGVVLALASLLVVAVVTVASRPSGRCRSLFEAAGQPRPYPERQAASCWALIGNNGQRLADERAIGVDAKLFSLSWANYAPGEGATDAAYLARKRAELAQLRAAGFEVILSLGIHDPPGWVHERYPDSYYVNQYGERYERELDNGSVNLVFNPAMRELARGYIRTVFADLGNDFAAVRVGGGRYGELTYPAAEYNGRENNYWGYDTNALASSPTPEWRPGEPSTRSEAARFLEWYLGALAEFQGWQIAAIREHYTGPLMVLYPSWGIRPGDVERALATNLDGSSAAERNGEIQRGFDFSRQVAAIDDPLVIVTTTWLDADASQDAGADPRYWSPVKYLAGLAQAHPLRLGMYGENTGRGDRAAMVLAAGQARRHGLLGMAWFNEEQLFSGEYATPEDYLRIVVGGRDE